MVTSPHSAADLISELVEALAELRRSATSVEEIALRSLESVEQGAGVAEALNSALPAETREMMNEALKRVENARHQIRLLVFSDGIKQGMSIGELGRKYGFSRQLAARYAKEARERFG
jgi:hypothetical protein